MAGAKTASRPENGLRARRCGLNRAANFKAAPASLESWLAAEARMTRTCLDAGLAQIQEMRSALATRIPDVGGDPVVELPDADLASMLRHAEDVVALTERIAAQARRATANLADLTLALGGAVTWDAPSSAALVEPKEFQAAQSAA